MAVETERIAVYTCVTAGYDELQPAPAGRSLDHFCFSDAPAPRIEGWTSMPLPHGAGAGAEANRYAKMHPHLLLPDYAISIYVDGNISVLSDPTALARSAMARGDIALFEHPFRDCIYAEAEECSALGYDWFWRVERQMRRYRAAGYPAGNGLYEANILIRRHDRPAIKALMDAWWREYMSGVRRDQLSLCYLAWKLQVPIVSLGPSQVRSRGAQFALREGHRKISASRSRARAWIYRRVRAMQAVRSAGG